MGKRPWPALSALSHSFRKLLYCPVVVVCPAFIDNSKREAEKYRTREGWFSLLTLEDILK